MPVDDVEAIHHRYGAERGFEDELGGAPLALGDVADDLDAFDGGEESGEDGAQGIGSDDARAERAFKFDGGVKRGGAEGLLGKAA